MNNIESQIFSISNFFPLDFFDQVLNRFNSLQFLLLLKPDAIKSVIVGQTNTTGVIVEYTYKDDL